MLFGVGFERGRCGCGCTVGRVLVGALIVVVVVVITIILVIVIVRHFVVIIVVVHLLRIRIVGLVAVQLLGILVASSSLARRCDGRLVGLLVDLVVTSVAIRCLAATAIAHLLVGEQLLAIAAATVAV